MARPPRPSTVSYASFKAGALPILKQCAQHHYTFKQKTDAVYDYCYTRALDPDVPAKVSLRNGDLLGGMLSFANGVGAHRVDIQSFGTMNVSGCAMEYRRALSETGIMLSEQARETTNRYLHVYALDERDEQLNWRISANVLPVDIPEITRRMCAVMARHANAGHFKVSPPSLTDKPDSMILYMDKNPAYDATRDDVRQALRGLGIQETFSCMWEELAPGIAVAAEPPSIEDGTIFSFGTYRCMLTVMAFDWAVHNNAGDDAQALGIGDFGTALDTYFNRYGVPTIAPHDQLQIIVGVAPHLPAARTVYLTDGARDALLEASALSQGLAQNTYVDAGAGIVNPPAIT